MSWNSIHKHYIEQDWSKIPSIFAEQVVSYFPTAGKILEIGSGLGQDSRFFCDSGFDVISTDFSEKVTHINESESQKQILSGKYNINTLDVLKWIPFVDDEFDVIYAHLSLHYFSEIQTIILDIQRVMKKWGVFAILLNSKDDPEYGNGDKIENDFFMIWWIEKRYFDIESAKRLFWEWFEIIVLDNQWETYKDREKWIHNLIRLVWKKI